MHLIYPEDQNMLCAFSLSTKHQHTYVISVLLEGAQFAIIQNSLHALNQIDMSCLRS